MSTMKAAVLESQGSIEVKQVPIPSVKADEALVEVKCIGICGSDVHYYEHGKIGRYEVKQPLILGHELAGVVVEVGENVQHIKVGDRVAVEPGVTCGRCENCKSGRYNLCPDVVFMATPPVDGAWAEYVAVRADFLFPMPDEMSFEEGALLEPLSVGFHAMKRAQVQPEDRVLVTGLGPIGQLAVAAARLFGVSEIYGSDVVEYRRELAKTMGVTDVCDPMTESLQDKVNEWSHGKGVDVIIETSGNAGAIAASTAHVKRGGKIVLVGLPAAASIGINVNELIDGEIDVLGVFRYANTYPAAIRALQSGKIQLEKTITHKFKLDDIQEALDMAIHQKNSSMKIMIYPK
ncbi:alcohol dehydrogenase [Paenibacillus sp. FSL H8-0548]|uniref:NAD(P)-dependent alcohol dehydrogenase n=1 Tax=Paenibacillus sp. FSL H8-0548 TaxID=1920422 RepID=UPI00096D4A97|nr:NAD(P)-dependent alcohol dehydrogenase [Paenibacillus sp. FSL H8-0548]OMF21942.1 alcohol dehydrogenase [Paenibacillus sp. FSL H8-0548]